MTDRMPAPLSTFEPGEGRRAPRARLRTDAPTLDLTGTWQFRWAPTVAGIAGAFWGELPVPALWQLHGYGRPAYTNVRYPFPLDPPAVPDENPTGEYRREFELPGTWPAGPAVLRFDGVDSAFTAWCNDVELGWSTGSRLTTEFEVGHLLRPGRNTVRVLVHQWSAASYLEDQDMWWLSGIFRDVTLLARPAGGIDDVFVHAGYDGGAGVLRVDGPAGARVRCAELELDLPAGEQVRLAGVEPWTAETPRLYEFTVATAAETLTLRAGFRTVTTTGGVLRVNGQPVRLRGVNRHEWHPEHGRVLDAATMRRDVELMKLHNINAVRTSHYPPHPDFLDLCDEFGLWVVLENDLETHGFEPIGWRDNPSDDPRWLPAYLDRMRRTVERDKNHPSVIMWSLGNESGTGSNLAAMADWVHGRDPARPVHYEGDWDSPYVDVYSRMYPTHAEVEAIGRQAEPVTVESAHDAHRRGIPFLMCEYGHAMGNGPGGLTEYQELIEASPRVAGGFIWEWIDHGIAQLTPDGREFFGYGGDFGEPLHDGNFVMDGLLFADRTPSPGLIEYAKVIEPVRISFAGGGIRIDNGYDFRSTAGLRFVWTVEAEGVEQAAGELAVPELAARGSITVPMPEIPTMQGETWLTIRVVQAAPTAWAPAGHVLGWGQARLAAGNRPGQPAGGAPDRDWFDALGTLRALGPWPVTGPRLDLWRAPTDNDRGNDGPLEPAWRAMGLHRLTHRVIEQAWSPESFVVRTRVAAAGTLRGLTATYTWTSTGPVLGLRVVIEPDGDWTEPLPRLGLRMQLPAELDQVEWFGAGPGEAYPDSRQAAWIGRFRATVDELQTPYAYPQENGNRAGVRWARLTDGGGRGLLIRGGPTFDLTVRRWTSEDLDAARHPYELTPRDVLCVNLDLGQTGLGTASCGPGVLPEHELHAHRAELTVTFELLP